MNRLVCAAVCTFFVCAGNAFAQEHVVKEVEIGSIMDSSQDVYGYRDVGHSQISDYGTVLRVRDISIIKPVLDGSNEGANAKDSSGKPIMLKGIEYTVSTHNKIYTLVQNKATGDHVFKTGDKVLIQTTGTYQRILSAEGLPGKQPHGIFHPGSAEPAADSDDH